MPKLSCSLMVCLLLACGDKAGVGPEDDTADPGVGDTDDSGGGEEGGEGGDDTGSDCPDPTTWFYDADGDGFGDDALSTEACDAPVAYVDLGGDCDDLSWAVNPAALEVCDGLDNDCDGSTDPDTASGSTSWFPDLDGDGFGDAAGEVLGCEAPSGHVAVAGDCDDSEALAWTDATEICGDGVDNDCSGDAPDCELAASGDLAVAGAFLPGPALNEGTGRSVAMLDHDGDGVGDLAVGAPNGNSNLGRAYIASGPITADRDLATAEVVLEPGSMSGSAYMGWRVASSGDVDGDGYEDLLVSTPGYPNTSSGHGTAFLLHGPMSGSVDVLADGAALTSTDPTAYLGWGIGSAPDLTGDGVVDLIVGAPYGPSSTEDAWLVPGPTVVSSDLESVGYRLSAEGPMGYTGLAFDGEHDLDGDGVADLVLGAGTCDVVAADQGRVYLLLGPITADRDLADADSIADATDTLDYFGMTLATGDVDGDGLADLAVGAYIADPGGQSSAGEVYLFTSPQPTALLASDADATLTGTTSLSLLGASLVQVDLDGDGLSDLVAGAPGNSGSVSPKVLAFFGPLSGTVPQASADRTWTTTEGTSQAGISMSARRDLNGDATAELAVGSTGNALFEGGAWVIAGGGL